MIAECKKCGEECRIYAKGICKNCYSKKMYKKASVEVKRKISTNWKKKIGKKAYNEYHKNYYHEKVKQKA